MADTQDVQQLKRRARRRLVGAIALVLLLVIVPPMVMDLEPRPVTTDLTVEIPSQTRGEVKTPPPVPSSPVPIATADRAAKASASEPSEQTDRAVAGKAAHSASESVPESKPDKAKSKPTSPLAVATVDPRQAREAQRAESILKGGAFVVPLGAYSNPANVKQLQAKLTRAGVKSYAEPVKGSASAQTRVAAGPFATRDEAEKARKKLVSLKGLGVVPGTITTRQ